MGFFVPEHRRRPRGHLVSVKATRAYLTGRTVVISESVRLPDEV